MEAYLQNAFIDANGLIWGIAPAGHGTEITTAFNLSAALTEDGIPLYKLENGSNVVNRDEAEIEADRASQELPQASWNDRIEAQVIYTAMMTDTLIEEE